MMKRVFIFLIVQLFCWQLFGQIPESFQDDEQMWNPKDGRLFGKIIDDKTGKGVAAASVELFVIKNDSAGKYKTQLVAAMLTRSNGDFNFDHIIPADSFRIIITYTGYEPVIKYIGISNKNRNSFAEMDLGNIVMEKKVKELSGVTIVSQKPALEMGIDRKIFNVASSLVSSGGTGLDVMQNIPSVTVDVDGNVLLRNSSPQIFVDGRPTILTLDQIPANDIERVELITNPSAKFDAASGGGIINIILKKNKRIGLNGLVSAGVGTPGQLNGNLNANLRDGKFNYFVSGNYNKSGGVSTSRTLRQNKENGVIDDYFNQHTSNDRLRRFSSLRFGADYFLDNRNTISVSQNLVRGRFNNNETQDQEYLNKLGEHEFSGLRNSDGRTQFNRNNTKLDFLHKFPEQEKELTANINYSYGNVKSNAAIENYYYNPDGTQYATPAFVRNDGKNNNDQWTVEVNFTDPKGENEKLETGIRTFINNYMSDFNAYSIANGSETKLPLSNSYKYREMINAAYITWTRQWKSFGLQAGLRAEYSKFDGELIDSALKFGYEYPKKINNIWDALFPSLFISKKVNDNIELQLNYSRRIHRPNFWQLNPFIDINDPVNLRQGNPQLRPEFINSLEFNYSHQYGNRNNFLGVIYFRNNPGDITRYSDTITAAQYQQLNNAAVDPNAIINTFINAQTSNRVGAELTLQQKIGDNFDITPTVDMQYRSVKAKFGNLNLDNSGFNWESKLILNYKFAIEKKSLFRNLGLQLTGNYESPEVIPQGRRTARYHVDFALKKDFLKDKKASLTFSINDVFNTQRYGTIYDTNNFYQDSYWRRRVRSFRLVLSYKFGDSEFSFRKRRNNQQNSENNFEEPPD